jgi:hypothetical protein
MKKGRFSVKWSILFGALILFSIGGMGFLWRGGLQSEWAAKVNGEGIPRKEFLKKLDARKNFYETRFGPEIFRGETGKQNLNRLKKEILDEMITERILLHEAKNAGYTSAPRGEVEKYLDDVKKQKGLSEADLRKMTGQNIEELKEELGRGWVISHFIEKAVLKGNPANGEILFSQWLDKAKARAGIETYEKLEPVSTVKASCCGSGCGGGGRAQPLDPKVEQEARTRALEYYEKKTQKKAADAKVTNFGCHIQIDIIENDKVVVSLTYNGGEIQEI